MIERGTVTIVGASINSGIKDTSVLDVVKKSFGNYTEYFVRATSTIRKEYYEGVLVGEYDHGPEEAITVYNHLTLEQIFAQRVGSGYTATWTTPLTEV